MRILLLFLLASCGIIESRKEIISIDTIPSGIEVYTRQNKKLIGKTPIFIEAKKNLQDSYIFKYNGLFLSKNEIPTDYCLYKPKDKVKGNENRKIEDVFHAMNPVTLVNGANYECVRAIRAKLEIEKPPEDLCKTVVVIPPKSNFMETSLEIYQAYKKQVFDKFKKSCDKIISPFQAEEYFSFLGIDHLFPPEDLSEIDAQKLFKIGFKFKATHIVFLPHVEKDNFLEVTPKIYDIHEGIQVDGKFSKTFTAHTKDLDTHWLLNFFLSSFRLVPNGVGILANTNNKYFITDSQKNEFGYTYDNFDLGITLDDIQYPAERWAFNFRMVPVLFLSGQIDQRNVKLTGLTLDFKLYIHLPPGGVFVARAGLGGAYVDISFPAQNINTGGLSFMTDVGLEFYFFPAERIYTSLGYKKYFLPNDSIKVNGASLTGQSHIFFEIGYFWPELRMGARSLFL